MATHYVAREGLGTSLDNVAHQCDVVYRSGQDGKPEDFNDDNWLASFFTVDGRTVAALVHSEYHGWAHPGMCTRRGQTHEAGQCWRNTITFAQSHDGGYHFSELAAPANFVAGAPFPYDRGTITGAVGYYAPANIVSARGYYYAMINAWHNQVQRSGSCLIRTRNLFDPKSWRAWDGQGFNVSFVNPFISVVAEPLTAHVCATVYGGAVESLTYDPASGEFIATEMPKDKRYGAPGAYSSASTDLIHWGRPKLIISDESLSALGTPGKWQYEYSSILDPTSPDRNFTTISASPYLYYVRLASGGSSYVRTLFRIRLQAND